MARMTLEELRTRTSTVDRAKVDATTEAEIEAHRAADGDADLGVPADAHVVESPRALRVRLGMTQPEMAAALSVPLGTWRNWEQGRVSLEPAAAALLRLVSHDPGAALRVLAEPAKQEPGGSSGCVVAGLAASEAPDTASFTGGSLWVLLDRAVAAQAGWRYGARKPPGVQRFTELLQDPEVRAWLSEREQGRANLDG